MTPAGTVALGLALVLVDVRVEGLDLVPDPLGWLVVLAGTRALRRIDPRFGRVLPWAVLAGLLSVPAVLRPADGLPADLAVVAGLAAVLLLCRTLGARAREHRDLRTAERFGAFAALALGGVVVLGAVAVLDASTGLTLSAGGLLLVVVLVLLVLQLALVVALAAAGERSYLRVERASSVAQARSADHGWSPRSSGSTASGDAGRDSR